MDIQLLGSSIKQQRKKYNLTQEKLAELLDVSTHYVYELERGLKVPSLPMMITIAELFNTTIDSMLTEENADADRDDYDELDALINSLSPTKRQEAYDTLCFLLPRMKP